MKISTKKIEYNHDGTVLEGYLAYDEDLQGRRPGVLIVHDWMGLGNHVVDRANKLAELGYVGFALDMYGKGKRGQKPEDGMKLSEPYMKDRNLMRSRARAGLVTLEGQEVADPTRLAAIGFCFGGTTALELARDGASLVGVVSFHGGLDFPDPIQPGKFKAKILICHGAEDSFASPAQVEAFQNDLRGVKADWQTILYGGAVHSFTLPRAGTDPSKGAAYHEPSDRRSWLAMKNFFEEIF